MRRKERKREEEEGRGRRKRIDTLNRKSSTGDYGEIKLDQWRRKGGKGRGEEEKKKGGGGEGGDITKDLHSSGTE